MMQPRPNKKVTTQPLAELHIPGYSFPALVTARLELQPVTMKHSAGIQKHVDNWDVIKYLDPMVPWPYPKDGAKLFVETCLPAFQSGEALTWAITQKGGDGEAIGLIGFQRKGNDWGRGFWLGMEHQGKKYMKEAVKAATDYFFSVPIAERFLTGTYVGNEASRAIKEQMPGRIIESGRRLERVRPGAEFTHEDIWEITRAEWLGLNEGGS